jgi:hypothetical protein
MSYYASTPANAAHTNSSRLSTVSGHSRGKTAPDIRRSRVLRGIRRSVLSVALGAVLTAVPAHAQVDVFTNRYDDQRTGANLSETSLTAANVNVAQFGKLYSYPVDGSVYAQPLYATGVTINGKARNVLYVATMNDKVYAFDADSSSATPLWVRDFTSPPAVTPIPITDLTAPGLNIIGNVGIQSTPVIDRETRTLYLVARTKENGAYVQRLHALDIVTGLSQAGSPVTISGSVPGNGMDATVDAIGPVITFDPKMQSQRAGLALVNGVVLVAWAGHEDIKPYHGWIMGFDKTTLTRVGIFCVTPDDVAGGIWQGGRAPMIDRAGYVYFATGNGGWNGNGNYGDSLLKFSAGAGGLSLEDSFTPANQWTLNVDDDDLSGSSFTMLPELVKGTNLMIGGGKEGVLYLLNSNAPLGHLQAGDPQAQKIPVQGGHVMGGPVFWTSPAGTLVYNWSEDDVLKSYQFTGTRLIETPYAQGGVMSPGHPGGSLTISARGSAQGTGIVWASMPTSQDGIHGKVAGMLRAFDAETLREIWTSEQNPARDRVGTLMKFVPPVVVNGKVFMPNHDGTVGVYGLLPVVVPDFDIAAGPASQVPAPGATGTFSVTVTPRGGFAGMVTLTAAGQPAGSSVTFSPASISGGGTSTMTVTLPSSSPAGTVAIVVTGTSGTIVHSAAPILINPPAPRAIGIDFVGNSLTTMAPSETAGVVVQSNWNSAPGAVRSAPLPLVDGSGASTTATVTWSANGAWSTPILDQPGDARMMKGYLDSSST